MTNPSRAFEHVQRRIPGGVNSPVRAFRAVGGTPVPMPPAPASVHLASTEGRHDELVA